MQHLKQFGCPRSGTTWTRELLQKNTDSHMFVNKGGYKHGILAELDDDWGVVLTVKHPHAWLVSILRYCNNAKPPSEQGFRLTRRWRNRLVNEWATNNTVWIRMFQDHPRFCLIKYEDLLRDTEGTLSTAAEVLGVDFEFTDPCPRRRIPSGLSYDSSVEDPDVANCLYYLDEQYKKDVPMEWLLDMTKMLTTSYWCPELEQLGYDL